MIVGQESLQPGKPELAHHTQCLFKSSHTARQGKSLCYRLRGEEVHASQQGGCSRYSQALTPASVHNLVTTPSTARHPAPDCSLFKMSSHVVVVSPDVKRVSVKVNPGTYMFDVLDEACKKLNLQTEKWSLK